MLPSLSLNPIIAHKCKAEEVSWPPVSFYCQPSIFSQLVFPEVSCEKCGCCLFLNSWVTVLCCHSEQRQPLDVDKCQHISGGTLYNCVDAEPHECLLFSHFFAVWCGFKKRNYFSMGLFFLSIYALCTSLLLLDKSMQPHQHWKCTSHLSTAYVHELHPRQTSWLVWNTKGDNWPWEHHYIQSNLYRYIIIKTQCWKRDSNEPLHK